MLYRYTGELGDSISFNEISYQFYPQSEIELPDDLVEFQYVARMIQNGILKAVSKPPSKTDEGEQEAAAVAPVTTDEPAPAPAPTTAPATEAK